MKKKVDSRIRTLIENGVKARHRSLFVVVGDKSRDQVVNLYYMLSKATVKARPTVLWCYKNKLEFSSSQRKRQKQIKRQQAKGLLDPEKMDEFTLFTSSTSIRHCYYKETEKILGQTYGVCILQDFEALTPNILARTIETVEGGGIIIMLLSKLTSLTSLYTMMMDVHSRFRTESHADVTGRFNERFILSLASCKACIFTDDELNILQVASFTRTIAPLSTVEIEAEKDLKELKESLHDTQPAGSLISKCKTLDQGKAVVTFLDAISEKTLKSTVALTASRGRGKSAALGLAIAGAIAFGYSNIFVTAPSPENLNTLFEFVFKGLDALDYKKQQDYEVRQDSASNNAVVRVDIFKQNRQTIQYIQPHEHEKVAQAELVVIDEAAAIPLPKVKALLGPYLVFLCSTVNGYEGTGRSLSLKLIEQLREQGSSKGGSGRPFREIVLAEPIRYAAADPIEAWLHELLCLNSANHVPSLSGRLPRPEECELFYVNRDTLFSYHKECEHFLQSMMSLYVASHYKNTPNDLQLMSDAPAHHLFVLLGETDETQNKMPDILCVIQVCLEGKISKSSALQSLSAGAAPSGDQIPWKVSEQFQDAEFPTLSGARIVRIAVHPNNQKAGYGTAAVEKLVRYYEGKFADLREDEDDELAKPTNPSLTEEATKASLMEERIKPRAKLPPLLENLSERRPEKLQYIGVSYGLTQPLHKFWTKLKFSPVYVSQAANSITGEHSCMVLRCIETTEIEAKDAGGRDWITPFNEDFRRRFISLLGTSFRHFTPGLALSVLNPKIDFSEGAQNDISAKDFFDSLITIHDMKRLENYSKSQADYHLIMDLVPTLARLYFTKRIPVTLSACQSAILLSFGLLLHDMSRVESHLGLPQSQILALFSKVIQKLHKFLSIVAAKQVEQTLAPVKEVTMEPHAISLDEELDDAAAQAKAGMKAKLLDEDAEDEAENDGQAQMFNPDLLQQFSINGDPDFEGSLAGGKMPKSGMVSIKSSKGQGDIKGKKRSSNKGSDSGRPAKKRKSS